MNTETMISIVSLIATIIIGVIQIKISKNQKSINNRIDKIETNFTQVYSKGRGIIGNSNNGDISNNKL